MYLRFEVFDHEKIHWLESYICDTAVTFLGAGIALAEPEVKEGGIPYPEGLHANGEGAWSAPQEINHVDSPYFTEIDVYRLENIPGRRVVLNHYPSYQQTTEYTCGPAAAITVLYWYGNKDYDEVSLTKEMKTRGYEYKEEFVDGCSSSGSTDYRQQHC